MNRPKTWATELAFFVVAFGMWLVAYTVVNENETGRALIPVVIPVLTAAVGAAFRMKSTNIKEFANL